MNRIRIWFDSAITIAGCVAMTILSLSLAINFYIDWGAEALAIVLAAAAVIWWYFWRVR